MAKGLRVRFQDAVTEFALEKVERSRLYGAKRRATIDAEGRLCSRASLTEDGQVLLRSGMSAQGYFDADGRQVDSDAIGAVDANGAPLALVPSTLGVEQALAGPVDAREVLDLSLTAVYRLTTTDVSPDLRAALDGGAVFRAPFNYRADYRAETAYLLSNADSVFALVGVPAAGRWLEPNAPPPEEEESDDDELDFEMF